MVLKLLIKFIRCGKIILKRGGFLKKYCFIGLLCAFVLSGCSNHTDTSIPVESVNKIEAPEIEKKKQK